jgi:hypothetical protein
MKNISQVKIMDDFIGKSQLAEIKEVMESNDFPWYYSKHKTGLDRPSTDPNYDFQFTHTFYDTFGPTSKYLMLLDPIISKLNPIAVIRVKANLTSRTPKRVTYGFHRDYVVENPSFLTAVFYINTNDGVTVFKDGTEVESIENRIVVFNPDLEHAGTSCTDETNRLVLNINYFPLIS